MKHIPFSLLFCLCFGIISILSASPIQAQETHAVIISEVQISGGTGHTNDDFIELYNTTDAPIDITDWQLRKKTKTDTTSTGISLKTFSTPTDMILIIPAKGYFLWTNSTGVFKSLTDAQFINSSTIADDNSIALFDATNMIIDAVTWGTGHTLPFLPSKLYTLNPPANTSIERDLISNTFIAQTQPTPQNTAGIQNKPLPSPSVTPIDTPTTLSAVIPKTISTETSVRINELLPNPSDTEEFIELFNCGNADVNLKNWSLRDASKTGHYTFKEDTIVQPRSYLTIMRSTFSFALNNTNESVTLLNPQGTVIDTISYLKSNKDASYSLSLSGWRWSPLITPNAVNQFADIPPTKVTIPQKIYIATPATFTAKTSGASDVQYLWNFGDKHISRLAQVAHTYAKKGTYAVTLTTLGSLDETMQTFTVHVKKQPKYMVDITEINPNPRGTDTGSEYIILKNTGTKKANLFHWSIATGTQKAHLTNHPITKSLILKPQEICIIKNDIALFSLPNKEGFIEIRQPNKKVIDTLQYSQDGTIPENARYQKSANNTWAWTLSGEVPVDETIANTNTPSPDTKEIKQSLFNTIDSLSPDELILLQTYINKQLELTETKQGANTTDALSQENIDTTLSDSLQSQSFLEDTRDTLISRIKQNIPPHATVAMFSLSASTFSNDTSLTTNNPSSIKLIIQHFNKNINTLFKKSPY